MVTQKITLNNPERFSKPYTISKEKLIKAASDAADRLEKMGKEHGLEFPGCWSVNYKYEYKHNRNWVGGMYTGCYWRAYELTGNKFFKNMAEKLTATFRQRLDDRIGVDDHDVGFAFLPSCVASYRLTGNEADRQTALDAAEYFYNTGYSKKGKFIIRDWKGWAAGHVEDARTMMDSLMNAPLLFWAAEETGKKEYAEAASAHVKTTEQYLVRNDASTYHHYQFDVETAAPVRGVTLQGRSDDSCWSRGHAWGVFGFPAAYGYNHESYLVDVHRDITYFMLNHLSDDLIPAWDFDFVSDKVIKDSSAGVISVCGMLEMAKMLPDDAEQKSIFESAAAQMLDSAIDRCTGELGIDYEGLLFHVTAALPQKLGIDQTAVYGDYFYLEALSRYLNPDFKMYW